MLQLALQGGSFNAGLSSSGGSSSSGSLTCDESLFQANSVHQATTQELTDYAGSYTGNLYTDDGTGNYVANSGTAGFSSSGLLTLNGVVKTPTSICVDNVDGGYGITLYVHFAGGHVDLWPNDTFSGAN